MRLLVLVSLLLPTAASAQLGIPMAPPPMPPQPVSTANVDVTQQAVDKAIATAMAETMASVTDSATVEVLDAIRESFAEPDEEAREPRATSPSRRRARRSASAQTFPALYEGYGHEGDGFPVRTTIVGTVTAAGSQRLCREGRPPVSRWLQVRLSGMPEGMAPIHVIVAVQCDEWAASHYLGRRVRIDAIKSLPEQEIRMARRDVPASDSPIYLTDPTRVAVD